ncbi:hypothetical protein KR222_007007, partial [Zaprionus bogoriensis]
KDQKRKKNKKKEDAEDDDDENNEQKSKSDGLPARQLEDGMPTFSWIGGLAKECLLSGYDIGDWHIDCTSIISKRLRFYSFGDCKETVTGGIMASENVGIFNLSQAWQTNGWFGTIGANAPTRFGLLTTLVKAGLVTGEEGGVDLEVNAGIENFPFKTEAVIPIMKPEPRLMAYVLYCPADYYLLGYRVEFDFEEKALDTHVLGLGYNDRNTELGCKLENFRNVRGSIFQRFGPLWAAALKVKILGEDRGEFAVGAQHQISDTSLIKTRVCTDGQLGIVFQQWVTPNILTKYHFSLKLDSPFRGEYRLGISLSLKG